MSGTERAGGRQRELRGDVEQVAAGPRLAPGKRPRTRAPSGGDLTSRAMAAIDAVRGNLMALEGSPEQSVAGTAMIECLLARNLAEARRVVELTRADELEAELRVVERRASD